MSLRRFLDEMEQRIEQLSRDGVFDNRRIVLFGASVSEGRCKRWLEERGHTVDAIIDNSRDKVGREYHGLTVQTPEDVLLPYDARCVIVIASVMYWSEMTQQVVDMGYAKKPQVMIVGVGAKQVRFRFADRALQVVKGALAWRKLKSASFGERSVFVAPQSSAGDVYVECLFVREFVRRNDLPAPVIVVPNGACHGMAQLCGFDEVIELEEDVIWNIVDYVRFTRRGPEHMVPMYYLTLNGAVGGLQGFKGLNFERMFRYAAFDLDDEVPHDAPTKRGDLEAAREALRERGLRPGKTVILAPYARTLVHGHRAEFWEVLARNLSLRGYDVCTSGFGPQEPAVAGTPLVQFGFPEAVAFVEAAGFFVGLRSGQCDAISSAKAVKVVLHERGPWIKTSLFEMFSLNGMGLCDDAVEFEFASAEMETVMGGVLGVFS